MKKYEIFGHTKELPSIIIEAENLDEALAKARKKQPKYCSGRVYDPKIRLINPR